MIYRQGWVDCGNCDETLIEFVSCSIGWVNCGSCDETLIEFIS